MQDPLGNIMGMLRNSGSIDPGQSQQRMANMRPLQQQHGVAPHASPQSGMMQQGRPQPGGAIPEEGVEGDIQVSEQDMTPVIIDQMNETILTLKVQLHQEQNPEKRKVMEQQANSLRKQVQSLGGEPIWAHESVEEGLQKIQGMGWVGWDRLKGAVSSIYQKMTSTPVHDPLKPTMYGHPATTPTRTTTTQPTRTTTTARSGADAYAQKLLEQRKTTPTTSSRGSGAEAYAQKLLEQRATPSEPSQTDPRLSGVSGVVSPTRRTDSGSWGSEYTQGMMQETQPFDELGELLSQIGAAKSPYQAPEQMATPEYVNQLFQQYGMEPATPEELEETARLMVERQTLGQRQIVEREIERFERDFPHEFERAKKDITEAAKSIGAEHQEEFASRGVYYSSIMAGNMAELDDKTMDIIGEISRDAANYVLELRADIRDIEQWAVLEREVVRRELEAEDKAMRERMMNLHLNVAIEADRFNLDRWYKEVQTDLQHRAQQLDELQMQVQLADRQGQHMAVAFMADNPLVASGLRSMGVNASQFQSMPLEQRAAIVQSIISGQDFMMQKEMHDAQVAATWASASLARAQAAAAGRTGTGTAAQAAPMVAPGDAMAHIDGRLTEARQAAQAGDWASANQMLTAARGFLSSVPSGTDLHKSYQQQIGQVDSQIRAQERSTAQTRTTQQRTTFQMPSWDDVWSRLAGDPSSTLR